MTIRSIFRLHKILWFRLLLLSVIGVLTYNAYTHAEDTEEWMPDPALRQAIREELKLPADEPLTKEKMLQLTRLYAIEKGIVNVQGLEFAVNLTALDLAGNAIKNISPLQRLTQLTHLGLGSTNLSDLSPLAFLKSLVDVDLGDNQISDLSPLSELTDLTKLDLQYNQISDLSPLADLISLRDINLINNPISDLGPLSNLTNLEVLDIYYGKVLDVSPLAGLEKLPILVMHPALRAVVRQELRLSNVVPLTKDNIKQLTRLHAWKKGIVNIQGLEFAVNLTELELAGNPIEDISPLRGLMQLTHLGLGATNLSVSDLSLLSTLTSLRYLALWDNQISDLSPLASLTSLVGLDLGGNQISDLSPLSALTALVGLALGDNQISDLSPLSVLMELRNLSLSNNPLSDLRPLSNLTNLEVLDIAYCKVSDVSPLVGLVNLRVLKLHHNLTRDFTPLLGLKNLTDFDNGGICEIAPLPPPVAERIANRTFPSITFSANSLIYNTEPVRRLTWWNDPDIFYDVATNHDMHHYSHRFGLGWHLTLIEPSYGLSTRLAGNPEAVMAEYQKYADRNPNMLFIPTIAVHGHNDLDAFPSDSDFWLRDADGQIIKDDYVSWDQWLLHILNPGLQQLIIERVVGIAECGYFNGVMFDSWAPFHFSIYEELYNIGEEEVIQAYITILKGIRARVRDDFLILVNRTKRKSPRYAEWINGSYMEINSDPLSGYTYKKLIEVEDSLLWNEEHLREPRINVLHGESVDQSIDSPDSLRWMRVITTLSLTHSDGYCTFRAPVDGGANIWYDFYDADLGYPVGEKGQRCDGCDGLFIREFTKGWAVYNRSGQPQKIQLPIQATGVESGITSTIHIVPDLDGEMYLKQETGTIADGTVKVLAFTTETPQESVSEWMPDAALRAAVREALEELGLPASAPFTKEKMLQLTSLKANHRGIVDITGLEFAMNLRKLQLGGRNRITDLRPLANLKNLTQLHLWHREIADMPPVTNLDISPLSGLINLEDLVLENSGISDISLLTELKALQGLGLSANNIEDISPLAGLKALQRLDLSENYIKDLSPLAGLTNLLELRITDNPAIDFSPLTALNLTDLHYDVDVNEDGVVNIQDLVIVANAFGEAEPDLNGDGVVNIQDLVIVANAF